MNWKLPNQLTVGRIVLAGVFFVLLGLYDQGSSSRANGWLLNWAFVTYLVAGITDVLDGWIARKYNLTSAFGRIVDPFVDKVLVLGAFAMLAGRNFAFAQAAGELDRQLPGWVTGGMLSGVQAWMVVVIMAREMIVSAIRGYSESCGVKFAATSAGKIKMLIQSVAICTILFQLANLPHTPWAVYLKIGMVWLATVSTLLSGLAYVNRAKGVLTANEN